MGVLQSIFDFMSKNLPVAVPATAIALEFILRMFKTDKPKSILLAVAGGLHVVSGIIGAASGFLDKVIPQRLN